DDPIPLDPGSGGMSIDHRALRAGDIIVSTTTGRISKLIQKTTDSPVSHTILYIGEVDGKARVIEAVESGVRNVLLTEALSDASLAVAFRHPKQNADNVRKLIRFADDKVKKKYDRWGLAQQLLCRKGKILCKVSTHDDTWYCSELILSGFESAGMPLTT